MKELRDKIKKMIGSKKICENTKQSYPWRGVNFIYILIIILLLSSLSAYAQDEQINNVLVLNSYHKGFLWTDNLVSGLISVLELEENNIELIIEYMDTKIQGYDTEYKQILFDFYKYKYQDHKFDIIISSDDNAFNFLREFHEELFPGVPVVFSGVNNIDAPNLVDPNEFTGILETTPFKKTIDLMLELHPKTRKIIIVVDKTPSGEYRWDITEPILSQYEDIEFIRLSDDYYSSEIEDMVGGLSEDTLVLFFTLYRDKSGRYLSLKEGTLLVSEASTRPVYITHQQVFPYGVVGGDLLGGFYHGEKVAEIAKRVLAGEELSGIPIVRKSPTQFMFDYIQLERWGIKLSDLPEDSIIVNKPFSFYNEYKYLVFGIIVIVIILVAIIIVLQANIMRRKKAEEKIRAAEDNLKNTFDLSPSIICKANLDTGYFVEASQAVTRILGYSVEEFTSMPFLELIHPDDQQKSTNEKVEQIKGKEVTFFENRYLCKDGSFKWMAWHGTKADENGIVTAIGSDIDVRKQAEGSVRRLSTAVEQSPSIIVITDTEGKLEYVNPKFTELTGYSSSEAIGQESNISKSGEQNSEYYKEMWDTIVSGKVWRGQFHNRKKNGELFWESASISAMLNESGDIINYIKIAEDITELKQVENELINAKEKAEESDRLKSAFLANMSHEIRTPMNGLLGFIHLLNEPNLSKAQIEQYTAIINKSSDRLLNTINDIIDISKIEAGEMIVSYTETSIDDVMEELYSFFLPEAKLKGLSLSLETSLSTEQAIVVTDSHKFHGILSNLIKNAIKYTEKGSIELGYVLKNDSEPVKVEIFVRDTGVGIPQDRIKAVFNRFEQADTGYLRVFEGSGLGLAISKAYAEMLGGEICVTSDEGKGSTFTFTIPYTKKGNLK
jgi:PAS domain S-box-containing protein